MNARSTFLNRLSDGDVLIADGATGTNLQARGLTPGALAESWVVERPDEVRGLHQEFIDAGADIILTCTFRANRYGLRASDYAEQVSELNRNAAALAREVANPAGRSVFVAGAMGPTGFMLEPLGSLTPAEVADAYAEQAAALADGGADLLVLETFYALEELDAAVDGVRRASDLPLVCSFSYDRGVRTMMGVRPVTMSNHARKLGVTAVGANCGTTLENMRLTVEELAQHAPDVPIWAKPNAGVPVGEPPRYPVTPDTMGRYARVLAEAGARSVGGCCGSTPAHVAAISRAIRSN